MKERWGALPLGELHPEGKCAYCGARGREGALCPDCGFKHQDPTLRLTVHPATRAQCLVCVDSVACMRRVEKRKRISP